jgi:Fur family transcriptional regulator, zinc uptake regulator
VNHRLLDSRMVKWGDTKLTQEYEKDTSSSLTFAADQAAASCGYTHHQHDHSIDSHSHDNCVHDTHTHSIAKRIIDAEVECRRRGVRWTALRSDVLTLILQAAKPVGAYDLLAKMAHQGRPPAPPTVYRSLDFLLEQGFIHRIMSINAFVPCCHPRHGHQAVFLICTRCHRVDEAESHDLKHALQVLARQGDFLPQQTTIEVAGLCLPCQQASVPEDLNDTSVLAAQSPTAKNFTVKKAQKAQVSGVQS